MFVNTYLSEIATASGSVGGIMKQTAGAVSLCPAASFTSHLAPLFRRRMYLSPRKICPCTHPKIIVFYLLEKMIIHIQMNEHMCIKSFATVYCSVCDHRENKFVFVRPNVLFYLWEQKLLGPLYLPAYVQGIICPKYLVASFTVTWWLWLRCSAVVPIMRSVV